jgi:Protein of unknown function (DUF3892)
MPVVTRVRKERSSDGTHEHIAGVCTMENYYYTRGQVVTGIDAGQDWKTFGGGQYAVIHKITYCRAAGCYLSPYITTAPDHTTANNLDNLPLC